MALTVETAELLEIFQWMTPEESSQVKGKTLDHVEEEIGDVMIYLTTLAVSLNIDPLAAAFKKLKLNAVKYPAEDQPDGRQNSSREPNLPGNSTPNSTA